MRILRWTTIVWGVLGTLVALAMTQAKSALDTWWLLAGIFGGGTLGLFLLGFVSRRVTSRAALGGVVAGVLVILWMTLSPKLDSLSAEWHSPFHGFLIIVFGTGTILLLGLVLTSFGKTRPNQPPSR
jgi:SSS family solute:Na+ symporter